jgi:DNA repair protein RadC
MKQLAKHDRPREKLQRSGVAALGDNELMAIILASGSRESGALELANRILERAGGLHALARRAPDELCVPGVGAARAAQIVAAVELGRRTLIRTALERPQYHTPQQLACYLLPQYGAAFRRTVRHRHARHQAPLDTSKGGCGWVARLGGRLST